MKNKIKKNQKIIFILLLTIICLIIPNTLANEIWINPFEVIDLKNDVSVSIISNEQQTSVIVDLNLSNEIHRDIIRINDCKEIKNYIFCIKDIEFNFSNNRGIVYQFQYHLPAVLLNYSEQKSTLTLNRYLENDPFVNLKNKMYINLTNEGKKEAKNIIYNEIIPQDITILSFSPKFKINNNILTWTGNINPNRQEQFYYEIIPTKEDVYQIKSNISYLSFDKKEEIISTFNINPKMGLIIEKEYSLNNQIGENITFFLNLKNGFDSEIEIISLKISTPENIKNIDWKGMIDINEEKKFSITHYVNQKIKDKINVNINYKINNIILTYSDNFEIDTKFYPLKIITNISNKNLNPGNVSEIIIKIRNENNISNIENIICEINAFNQNYNVDFKNLRPNNNFRIGSFIYTAPTTNVNLFNEIETICNYNLENIKYIERKSKLITVEPIRRETDNEIIFESKVIVGDNLLNIDNEEKKEIEIIEKNLTEEVYEKVENNSQDKIEQINENKKNWFTKLLYWLRLKK